MRISTAVMFLGLVGCLGSLAACLDVDPLGGDDPMPDLSEVVRPQPDLLNITHESSSTSSILVGWAFKDASLSAVSFKIKWHRQQDSDDKPVTSTGDLPYDTAEYEIRDLVSNSKYNICVEMRLTAASEVVVSHPPEVRRQCLTLATIPVVRYQDLLILACVVGYLLLMCLVGLLCWMRARASFNRRYREQQEEAGEPEDGCSESSSYVRSSTGARVPDYPEKAAGDVVTSRDRGFKNTSYPEVNNHNNDHRDIPYIDDERRETKRLL